MSRQGPEAAANSHGNIPIPPAQLEIIVEMPLESFMISESLCDRHKIGVAIYGKVCFSTR